MNTPKHQRLNADAVSDFLNFWKGKKSFVSTAHAYYTFQARVTYNARGKETKSENKVQVKPSRFGPMEFLIEDAGILHTDSFHMSFSPTFQKFRFNSSSGSLTIEGNSIFMSGDYKVRLRVRRSS